ncbi:hypothetical protein DFH08DRAFT_25208 [Mycena albidolilacea]|uniref:F-box domain-containing protein n=1 Tax=Mycena albidolilacea TaxID=1033008 RepID=A0AAD7AUT0_9AGAR|nr:hypothetical protein DFH08DRAFT_25208 [Mycena albidolilacea]
MTSNPLLVQELVDECLSYLSDAKDLERCALVCRPWSHVAQRALFRVVSIPRSSSAWNRLENTLRTSPHLVPHIRTLFLRSIHFQITELNKICNFPFTHVENIAVDHSGPMSPMVELQALLSVRSLRRLKLDYYFFDTAAFLPIWDMCSTNIRHLDLSCNSTSGHILRPPSAPIAPIALESLRVDTHVKGIGYWFNHDLCPFDISRLTVLSLGAHSSITDWSRMAPALRTIKALEFTISDIEDVEEPLDLSLFPNVSFLHIAIDVRELSTVLDCLSTIPSDSHVRQIVLSFVYSRFTVSDELDSKLTELALESVGLEVDAAEYRSWVSHFPQLSSRNLVRHRAHLSVLLGLMF